MYRLYWSQGHREETFSQYETYEEAKRQADHDLLNGPDVLRIEELDDEGVVTNIEEL